VSPKCAPTYRQLYPVSRHVLRDIADQFQRWLKGRSEKRNIPVADAPKGRRETSSIHISKAQTSMPS
jgi:hypothetical protein